ncbi:hypothetical protein ACQEU8_19125 [Streptomyces sp. CA-250714]|uniref:hypothetical protein n=1 Tax=Streptomyces sp. CA-250714 TaxID=3240060 RepID=UPI003D92E44B
MHRHRLERRAARLPGRVTSVEMDAELAVSARENLSVAGAVAAHVFVDRAAGWAAGASYERGFSIYVVDPIAWAWVEQTRPGGRVVPPAARARGADRRRGRHLRPGLGPGPGDVHAPQHERAVERHFHALRDDANLLWLLVR